MKSIFLWLRKNKLQTFLVTIIYFALVIFPHKWVGLRVTKAFSGISRAQYDLTILILSLGLLFFLLTLIFKRIKVHPQKVKLLAFIGFTIACMFVVNSFLFVVNIESVHYVQYGIGVMLIFMLIENYFVGLFAAFIVGVIDEAYQYFYLFPEGTAYYDFNDIITNLLGAAFGLLILYAFEFAEKHYEKSILKRGFLFPLLSISLFFIALLQTNLLSVYPSEKKFMLIKKSGDRENFELGSGIWDVQGPNGDRVNSEMQLDNSGDWCIRLSGNSKSSIMTSSSMNFSSYDSLLISLDFMTKGMAKKDAFHLEIKSQKNKNWKLLKTWLFRRDFKNGQQKNATIYAKAPLSARFRIRCNANSKKDTVYIDDVVINGFFKAGFYIVKPLEGLLIIIGLFLCYFYCFRSKNLEMS